MRIQIPNTAWQYCISARTASIINPLSSYTGTARYGSRNTGILQIGNVKYNKIRKMNAESIGIQEKLYLQ
jgi:hypothetical protein